MFLQELPVFVNIWHPIYEFNSPLVAFSCHLALFDVMLLNFMKYKNSLHCGATSSSLESLINLDKMYLSVVLWHLNIIMPGSDSFCCRCRGSIDINSFSFSHWINKLTSLMLLLRTLSFVNVWIFPRMLSLQAFIKGQRRFRTIKRLRLPEPVLM